MDASSVGRITDDNKHHDIMFLTACAESLGKSVDHTARDTVLLLLTAATATAVRYASSGDGFPLDLRELMLEALRVVRDMNSA